MAHLQFYYIPDPRTASHRGHMVPEDHPYLVWHPFSTGSPDESSQQTRDWFYCQEPSL
jgi:hypothetical protein